MHLRSENVAVAVVVVVPLVVSPLQRCDWILCAPRLCKVLLKRKHWYYTTHFVLILFLLTSCVFSSFFLDAGDQVHKALARTQHTRTHRQREGKRERERERERATNAATTAPVCPAFPTLLQK